MTGRCRADAGPGNGRSTRAGRLASDETVVDGFEHIVDAFLGMLHGENTGKIIVAAPFSAFVRMVEARRRAAQDWIPKATVEAEDDGAVLSLVSEGHGVARPRAGAPIRTPFRRRPGGP